MDKPDLVNKFMESAYHDGNRAYIQDGNHVVYVPYASPDEPKFWSLKQIQWDLNRWHALRAYQDEQRKKGVPINYYHMPHFADRDHTINGVEYIFGFVQDDPEIRVFSDSCIAKFTNFRWGEGYPNTN